MRRATIAGGRGWVKKYISIHALREESDYFKSCFKKWDKIYFNPRSPWGERQAVVDLIQPLIHFNPRSPWGERPIYWLLKAIEVLFQSTLSVRRATKTVLEQLHDRSISIHALREESDALCRELSKCLYKFQSTLSVRRATKQTDSKPWCDNNFNPRSPWGERPYYG